VNVSLQFESVGLETTIMRRSKSYPHILRSDRVSIHQDHPSYRPAQWDIFGEGFTIHVTDFFPNAHAVAVTSFRKHSSAIRFDTSELGVATQRKSSREAAPWRRETYSLTSSAVTRSLGHLDLGRRSPYRINDSGRTRRLRGPLIQRRHAGSLRTRHADVVQQSQWSNMESTASCL
jgi:hypothetical protein